MKKILFMFLMYIFCSNLCAVEYDVLPKENSLKKIQSLLEEYHPGKRYKVDENIKLFRNTLVGTWSGGDWGIISFYKNKRFRVEANHSSPYKKDIYKGKWRVDGNTIYLKVDGATYKEWREYKVDYFYLRKYTFDHIKNKFTRKLREQEYKGLNRYGFSIVMDDNTYKKELLVSFSMSFFLLQELDPQEKK